MRRIIIIEIIGLLLLVLSQTQFSLSPHLGLVVYIVFLAVFLGVRRYVNKEKNSGDLNKKRLKSALMINAVGLALVVIWINSSLQSIAEINGGASSLVLGLVFIANKFIVPLWLMIEMVRLIFSLKLKNVIVIFIAYLLLGFLASVGFDYMTTAVVLVYAFTTGFLQTKRGQEFKKDYGLEVGDKYNFVDVDFLLAIIFFSYIVVKATGFSNIFMEISPEESMILHTIENSLWDGGLMMVLSGILLYILLGKGLVYKIYDIIDKFLRGLLDDLNIKDME